jgi:dual specificity tyrosine-phosphorylation-regulated kinase 2/3/4
MGNAKGTNAINCHPVTSGNPRRVEPIDFGSCIGRSSSFVRRQNSSARAGAHALGESDAMGPPITSAAAKTRRKSQFPGPTANVPIPRTARKSVGPGILPSDLGGQSFSRRRQTIVHTGSVVVNGPTDLLGPVGNEGVSRAQDSRHTEGLRTPATSRDARVKSMQPKPRWAQDQSLTLINSPPTASSISTARSPARSTGQRTNTPSSSSKRLSMMPNTTHATGLGARTISPTDARRMKRLSIMPNPPPMPYTPPTPQPDPPYYTGTRSAAQSPSMIPRKSVTPSSNRTTPDPNRKSYSSGISNSSSTSYNSFLNSTGSLRISQNLSGSRLPTPKARNEGEATGGEEVVPPVPAIPKAYESPKTEFEAPYFVGRKSSLPSNASSSSTSTADGESYHTADNALPKVDRETWQRRGPTIEASSGTEKKANSGTNNNRRTLQPLRLPPLNLLPLSTPTTEKINALYDLPALSNPGTTTPPPKLGHATTPSTPMTASKATFFSRSRHNEDAVPMQAQMRSSSSHHAMRTETSSYYEPSSSSNSISTPVEPQTHRTSRMTRSPFISSSLPKSSGDFHYLRPKGGEPNGVGGAPEVKSSRLTGPRSQKSTKAIQDHASSMELPSPTGATTPSFGNNLRRKLSLTRKRSSSKTPADSDAELPPKPPKHDHMPPPRLPASATWSGPFLPSPSPTQHTNHLQSRRKPSGSNNTIHHDRSRSSTWTTESSPKKDPMPPDYSAVLGPKRTLRSALEGGSRANGLGLKDFLQEAKTLETQFDRDDLSAEDEMKRLASKRKETEIAAKEMDALRRRATAKERVGPMQALRMAHLNIFERGEIVDFKDVYFCGTQNAKKHIGDLSAESTNFGYDDERGDYCIVSGDHLAYRYEIVDILGKGSFGQVARCVDHKTGGLVAIKIIRNKKRFHQQALVEVEILQKLREWVS